MEAKEDWLIDRLDFQGICWNEWTEWTELEGWGPGEGSAPLEGQILVRPVPWLFEQ